MKPENKTNDDRDFRLEFSDETFDPLGDDDCCPNCGGQMSDHEDAFIDGTVVFDEAEDFNNFELFDIDETDYEDDEIVLAEAERETSILLKGDMIALIGVAIIEDKGAMFRFDPREGRPIFREYETRNKTYQAFDESKKVSIKNGWRLAYSGPILEG